MQANLDGEASPSQVLAVLWSRVTACLLLAAPLSALSQNKLPLLAGPELGLPSLWRVLFGFLLMVGIAFGVVAFLRKGKRWLPLAVIAQDESIVVISRRQLSRNLNVHIIKVHEQNFMVVSSAHQLAVTQLATSHAQDSTDESK